MSSARVRRTRQRLDQLLVERGLAETRTRAQALVMGGHVRVGEGAASRTDRKPGDLVETTIALEVEAPPPFVSRGGLKLRAALDVFGVEPVGLVCLDVGSSTGGFTDLLLQRDASRVYAVDVGRGQLAEALRHDPRVVSMERTNARALGPGMLPTAVDLAVVDVSFISLDRILRPVATCFGPLGGKIVALVKPQFEAGRKQVRDGVVRDPKVHRQTLETVARYALGIGLKLRSAVASPLTGPAGNREFFLELEVPAGFVARDGEPPELPEEWASKFGELAGA
ncbi:MAG TPA: TlyA family RNA methyltransferase [Candidatus Limnocylindrales bacterium]|jgi:23S rRNA (cytidine1920-2'-O)/16S rRNA (cytidine1409-2'-O)-methyltransferase